MLIDKRNLDTDIFNFEKPYNVQFKMKIANAVKFRNSKITYTMLITRVHEEGNKIVKWKVENSWGKKRYYVRNKY